MAWTGLSFAPSSPRGSGREVVASVPGRTGISWTLVVSASAIAVAMLSGCSKHPPAAKPDLRAERLAKLDAMGRKCGYPRSGWNLFGADELHLQPDPNERYEVLECMLGEIRKSDVPFKIGFVGNEAYAPGNAQ